MFRLLWRRLWPLFCGLAVFGVAASPVFAAGQVRRGAAPSWVQDLPIPAPKPGRVRQVTDGLYYLLIDDEDRPGRPIEVRYVRTVYKVTDRTGLEAAASLSVTYDPASENVVLHRARVWRNGVAEDRLKDADLQIMRREKELDKGVFDGRKTAHLELKDVRVGDVVDLAYSVEGSDPQVAGAYQGNASLTWSTPTALTRYRLLWPHGQPIAFRAYAGAPNPQITRGPDRDEYVWQTLDPAPVQKETHAPDWLDQWARVNVSSMTSWREVAAWSLPFYPRDAALPPAWAAKADDIARRFPNRRDRITEALRLVQDDIRYVSIASTYRPRPPAEVIRSAYGDCKDKALLLVTLLRRLGVEAAPALTDSDHGRSLPDRVPGVDEFDHAIVRIQLDGKAYWVDPTLSQEGGRFPALDSLDYGWALPIRPGQAGLEAVPVTSPSQPTVDVLERYELPRGDGHDLTLHVTTTYGADDADSLRSDLASKSPAEIERQYLEFYAGLYPGIHRSKPMEVDDQRDANRLTVVEDYVIPAVALKHGDLSKAFPIKASSLSSYKDPPTGERRLPLWVSYPVNVRHRMVLATPGHRPPAPEAVDFKGKTFTLSRASQRDGDILTVTETLVGVRELVPPAEVEAFRSDVSKLDDTVYATLDLTSGRGGTIGGEDKLIAWIVILAILAPLGGLAFFGVRSALKADASYVSEGEFYPVTLGKFLLMAVLTLGLYPMFWRWKCWRWHARTSGQDIFPFWRAVFNIFWLLPLFNQVNRRLADRALPNAAGVSAAIAYAGLTLLGLWLNWYKAAPVWLHWPIYLGFLCDLPSVIAVRRLNAPDSVVVKRNSRYSWHSAVAVLFGLISWLGLLASGK